MFELDPVVPWGRSFNEYVRMFALSDEDLGHTILGCGDGPASFNAEATPRGHRVTIETVPYECQRGGNEMMRVLVGRAD